MGLSGANDWTVAIEKEGYPELKKLYGIYDKTDLVKAKCWPEFGHNYNQVAREFMYNWFNKHLSLGQQEPVKEAPFVPVPPSQLEIFPKGAKLPEGILSTAELRGKLIQEAKESISSIREELAKGNAKPLQEFLDPLMEMAVGKPRRIGTNRSLPKDLVIWRKPWATCWDENWRPSQAPLAVIEWKTSRGSKGGTKAAHDEAWLRAFSRTNEKSVGYSVSVAFPGAGNPCRVVAARFVRGDHDAEWFTA
jgi:hypothetical protein